MLRAEKTLADVAQMLTKCTYIHERVSLSLDGTLNREKTG
jgi:hypothetical protein